MTMQQEFQAVIENLDSRPWIQGQAVSEGNLAVCAHGAVMTCQGLEPGDDEIIRAVMRQKGLSEEWNDDEGRTKAEVLDLMRSIEVSDDALAATFGPQWKAVVALVRRAAALTDEECGSMVTASRAIHYDPKPVMHSYALERTVTDHDADPSADGLFAAEAATYKAGLGDARDAAQHAARQAANVAQELIRIDSRADSAVWVAAAALAARDQIGAHDFTQAHYDILTWPWASVIGPAHPDDTPTGPITAVPPSDDREVDDERYDGGWHEDVCPPCEVGLTDPGEHRNCVFAMPHFTLRGWLKSVFKPEPAVLGVSYGPYDAESPAAAKRAEWKAALGIGKRKNE